MREIRVVQSPAEAVAQELLNSATEVLVAERLQEKPQINIGLAGGHSPLGAYEIAAAMDGDWSRVNIWFGDERCVPIHDLNSNFGSINQVFFERIPVNRRPQVFRIHGDLPPGSAAADYETQMRTEMGNEPMFDLLILGLGKDGHTASLFPGKPALDERRRFVVEVPHPGLEPYVPRVTVTLPIINAARRVIFLATGSDKARAVKDSFGENSDPWTPASLVRPTRGDLIVYLDEGAASCL